MVWFLHLQVGGDSDSDNMQEDIGSDEVRACLTHDPALGVEGLSHTWDPWGCVFTPRSIKPRPRGSPLGCSRCWNVTN